MRVVSQQRNYSVDFDRTLFWTQSNVIYAQTGDRGCVFGSYDSPERAKKVFMDMHDFYYKSGRPNTVFYMPEV